MSLKRKLTGILCFFIVAHILAYTFGWIHFFLPCVGDIKKLKFSTECTGGIPWKNFIKLYIFIKINPLGACQCCFVKLNSGEYSGQTFFCSN